MESLSANEAKTHFGDLLLKVQREPIQINQNDKAIAVVLSVEDYQNLETLKIELLKTSVAQAKEDIKAGRTIDGNYLFDKLISGEHD